MASLVEVKVPKRELKRIDNMMSAIPKRIPSVMSTSINRTAKTARSRITKEIAKHITLKQKDIRSQIYIEKASRSRWRADVRVRGNKIPLIKFGARKLKGAKGGIGYKISKTGSREKILYDPDTNRVFIGTMRSGYIGVYARLERPTWSGGKRTKIIQRFGPSLPSVYENAQGLARTILRDTKDTLIKNLRDRVEWELLKAKKK